MVILRYRTGNRFRVRMTAEQAAALVEARPEWLAGLTIVGGVDDYVRSHVPMRLPPWRMMDTTHGAAN